MAQTTDASSRKTGLRLADIVGTVDAPSFKDTVGCHSSEDQNTSPQYVLPPDVDETTFLAFVKEVQSVLGEEHVSINTSETNQAQADYTSQPKFYVSWICVSTNNNPVFCQLIIVMRIVSATGLLCHTSYLGTHGVSCHSAKQR